MNTRRRPVLRGAKLLGIALATTAAILVALWLLPRPRASVPFGATATSLTEPFPTDNYCTLEDGLYLGGILSAPPPGTVAILNLCETKDPYAVAIERWQPIPDAAPAPSLEWLAAQVQFMNEQRLAKRTLFVHCHGGVSRSVLVTTAYLMQRDHCSRDTALATIRTKRPVANPNPAFMVLLLEWENLLAQQASRR